MRRNFKLKAGIAIAVGLILSVALSAKIPLKPDLAVAKITVDRDCNLAVVVKNMGRGMLPDYVYSKHHPKSAGVYVFINGTGWGGESIWKFDPGKKLQKPGGHTTCILKYKVGSPIHVKAVVDRWNDVKEANERNNSLAKNKLSCSSPGSSRLPDLVVKYIRLIKDCKIEVTIANIGKAGVPASYYDNPDAVAVQMYNGTKPWGGMILKMFDPDGKLKSPGGVATHTWFPDAANLNLNAGTHTIKVIADVHNALTEAKETNNSLVKRLSCNKVGNSIGTTVGTLGTLGTIKRFSIDNIRFSPTSPASLNFEDKVKIKFDYSSSQKVYIFARPMTKGSTTPNYAAHPSKLYPQGSGKGDGFFTIKKGAVTVDQVRFQMYDKSKTNVLYEKFVTVKYNFPKLRTMVPGQVVAAISTPAKAPQRFMLDFTDAYLVFSNPSHSIQIAAQSTVLSYGGDWEKCQLKPYLYHIRQKFWKNFYWKVNTSRKEVYEVSGGTFCQSGGSEKKLDIKVDVVGGSNTTPPQRFFLRFPEAHLVYIVGSIAVQLATGNKVLSYCQDFRKCNLSASVYHLKQNVWKGFYWQIDTQQKQVMKMSGSFCKPGSGGNPLNIGVRVIN
jgi:hypothetical protein